MGIKESKIALHKAWTLDEENKLNGIYISKEDIGCIGQLNNGFVLDRYPQPFWGNITNPEVIVLGLNPSDEFITDRLESILFSKEIEDNLKGNRPLNWENLKTDLSTDLIKTKEVLGSESKTFKLLDLFKDYPHLSNNKKKLWWDKVFDGYYYDPNEIGFFNLVGYASKDSNSLNDSSIKKELFTTKILIKYLNDLIEEKTTKLIIIVWGKKNWIENGLKVNGKELIVVNEKNYRNKQLRYVKDIKGILEKLDINSINEL